MDAIIDYRGKTPEKKSFGIPLVTAKVVKDGRIETPEEFIAEEDFDAWMRRGLPCAGDVVMTTEAPLGEVAQLDGTKVALAQRIIGLRGKASILDNDFLKYSMQSAYVQEQLLARASGTTVLGIKQSELRRVSLPLPPLPEQRAIAHILGTLDDKIEVNRRLNKTLEAIARALFKSWFVDFDPVRVKAAGRQPFGMDAETAKLFPSEFEDSELGQIPRGWRVATVADVARQVRDGVDPGDVPLGTPYIGLEHMPQRSIALAVWGTAADVQSQKARFKVGNILFGKLRPYFHKVGVAPVNGVCSTDIVVVEPVASHLFGVALGHLSSSEFVAFTNAAADGTKMPRTSWSRMAAYRIVVPDSGPASAFNRIAGSVVERIRCSGFEAMTLSSLRDTLLPKLLSGEIRLKDAEHAVGHAV